MYSTDDDAFSQKTIHKNQTTFLQEQFCSIAGTDGTAHLKCDGYGVMLYCKPQKYPVNTNEH